MGPLQQAAAARKAKMAAKTERTRSPAQGGGGSARGRSRSAVAREPLEAGGEDVYTRRGGGPFGEVAVNEQWGGNHHRWHERNVNEAPAAAQLLDGGAAAGWEEEDELEESTPQPSALERMLELKGERHCCPHLHRLPLSPRQPPAISSTSSASSPP